MRLGEGTRLLVLGATSSIGRATALRLAGRGCALFLAGRSGAELDAVAGDLRVRFDATVRTGVFEALDYSAHADLVTSAVREMGGLDGALLFFGDLGDADAARHEFREARRIVEVNYLAAVSVLTNLADLFEAQRAGVIVGVSSVAGDRGRQSNYVYGSAKGALSLFLQGLRNRLAPSNVQVVTVKPGPVDTPMTRGMAVGRLLAPPDKIARGIVRAVEKGSDVAYLPWYWKWIMLVIRAVPERVFKRLRL